MILKQDEDRENYKLHQSILTKINDKKLPEKTGEQRQEYSIQARKKWTKIFKGLKGKIFNL